MTLLVVIFMQSCSNKPQSSTCLEAEWSEEKLVEGIVSAYQPMDIKGHGSRESFRLDSLFFSYSDFLITGFYNNSCVKGGLVCSNGQRLRIRYKSKCGIIHEIVNIETLKNLE